MSQHRNSSFVQFKSLILFVLFAVATIASNGLSAQTKPATSKAKPAAATGVSTEKVAGGTPGETARVDSAALMNGPVILATDTVFSVQEKLMGHTSSTESLAISPDG